MRRLLALALIAIFLSSCGYQLVGRGGGFPQGVTKVAVLPFKNKTDQSGLEAEVNTVFMSELQSNGKAAVVSSKEGADGWFEGTIVTYVSRPIAYNSARIITERRLVVTAQVNFVVKDQEKPFFSQDAITGKGEYRITNDLGVDTRSEKEARKKALVDLSRRIISLVTEGF